ncbi:MAG TPA: divalent-cation tolerance protein CutA [Terriglobales bacterium]|nr:divalent-cation tolerance protein CutA [Terriglobales bacterium]
MTDKIIALTNTGSEEEARSIARALVERKLAACVNIIPGVESIYWWKGKIETASEWTLLIKTVRTNFEPIRDAIRELHSYDLPECIAITLESGSPEYLNWISESLKA